MGLSNVNLGWQWRVRHCWVGLREWSTPRDAFRENDASQIADSRRALKQTPVAISGQEELTDSSDGLEFAWAAVICDGAAVPLPADYANRRVL